MATRDTNDLENKKFDDNGNVKVNLVEGTVNLSAASAFSDVSNTDKKGLVDTDRHVQVDVLTMPDVSVDTTGLATSANQTTIIGHIDGLEGLLTTIDADTSNISTKIDTLAGAVSGTEVQVDVLTMPTTTVQATNLDIRDLSSASDSVAATQSGTWNITNVSGTVSLPTGAATAAKQPALGTAGTASTDVLTVQGIASMTALKVDGSAVTQPVSGTVTANAGTNLNTSALALETTATSIKTAVEIIDNAISGNEMQVDVVGALPAGTNAIGKLAANSGVDIGDVDVTSLPALAAGTNAIGKLLPPDIDVTGHTNYARKYYTNSGAATDGIIWSPAAGKRWHVVSLYIQVSAAATATLEDDKAGGDDPVWKSELAANSGVFLVFPEKYPLASGEDAADLLITTTAGNVYVTVTGYEI